MNGPDVLFRHGHEFGKAAVGVDAQNIDLFTDVAVARAAGLTNAAADVSFGADPLADGDAVDGGAHGVDPTDEFVARGDADLDAASAPGIPLINVAIGAADAGVRDRD